MPELPSEEFMTGLKQAAIALHECYMTFRQSGFTEQQAMQLTVAILHGAGNTPTQETT